MISLTTITREYRVFSQDIETWIKEGWFPAYEWHNGRRYWDSNKFNAFIAGAEIAPPATQGGTGSATNENLLPLITLAASLIIFKLF